MGIKSLEGTSLSLQVCGEIFELCWERWMLRKGVQVGGEPQKLIEEVDVRGDTLGQTNRGTPCVCMLLTIVCACVPHTASARGPRT